MKKLGVLFAILATAVFCTCTREVYLQGETIYVPIEGEEIFTDDGIQKWMLADMPKLTGNSFTPTVNYYFNISGYGDYEGGRFVALANNGTYAYSNDAVMWTHVSDEQKLILNNTWEEDPPRLEPFHIKKIIYGNGVFIGIPDYYDKVYIYSSDGGATWTNKKFSEVFSEELYDELFGEVSDKFISDIVFGDGKFLMVTKNNITAYSTDGLAWTLGGTIESFHTSDASDKEFISLTFGNGVFVAVNHAGEPAYSTDGGATWTTVEFQGDTADEQNIYTYMAEASSRVAFGQGVFLMAKGLGDDYEYSNFWYSQDGMQWTKVQVPEIESASTSRLYADTLMYANGQFIYVYHNRSSKYMLATSIDGGKTWRVSVHSLINAYSTLSYGKNRFVIVDKYTAAVAQ